MKKVFVVTDNKLIFDEFRKIVANKDNIIIEKSYSFALEIVISVRGLGG